jgi:hypothetical protein
VNLREIGGFAVPSRPRTAKRAAQPDPVVAAAAAAGARAALAAAGAALEGLTDKAPVLGGG